MIGSLAAAARPRWPAPRRTGAVQGTARRIAQGAGRKVRQTWHGIRTMNCEGLGLRFGANVRVDRLGVLFGAEHIAIASNVRDRRL